MPYKAMSPDDATLVKSDFDVAYVNPLSSVMADYVYNSLLIGRPYLFQMFEDVEIVTRFANLKLRGQQADLAISGTGSAYTLATTASEVLPNLRLVSRPDAQRIRWSDLVQQKTELWPIEYLIPGGAYLQ